MVNAMSVQTFDQTPEQLAKTIVVTESAQGHLAEQLKKLGKLGVRLSLKEAGCTGYKYVLEEVTSAQEGDITIAFEGGVNLFVDPAHAAAFKDLQIDFVEQGLNKQLILNNPNVKDECGCGESFNV